VRVAALIPWVAGFLVYHWIAPTGPEWWTTMITSLFGVPLSEQLLWLGASVPSFGVAFLIAAVTTRLSSSSWRE
jgi:hypothetical protein